MSPKLLTIITCLSLILCTPAFAGKGRLQQLNLSAEQKTQLEVIEKDSQAKIRNLLTPEQSSQLNQAIASGQSFQKALKTLTLTTEQQSQVSAIQKQTKQEFQGVLTPDQLNQLGTTKKEQPQEQ
jgi:Spy/CpxP family protein refolding chaperone